MIDIELENNIVKFIDFNEYYKLISILQNNIENSNVLKSVCSLLKKCADNNIDIDELFDTFNEFDALCEEYDRLFHEYCELL